MLAALNSLFDQLGRPGKAALILLAATAVFVNANLSPLESRNRELDELIVKASKETGDAGPGLVRTASPSAKLAAFYGFFEREETTTDWLAKLYALAQKTGVEMRVADYQLVKDRGRLDRYQVSLPLSGDYARIRAFIENALQQIPVMSLDQLNFRRKRTNDTTVETEVRFTLYLPRT